MSCYDATTMIDCSVISKAALVLFSTTLSTTGTRQHHGHSSSPLQSNGTLQRHRTRHHWWWVLCSSPGFLDSWQLIQLSRMWEDLENQCSISFFSSVCQKEISKRKPLDLRLAVVELALGVAAAKISSDLFFFVVHQHELCSLSAKQEVLI